MNILPELALLWLYYSSWILIVSIGSRQPFTCALQILIRIVTRLQPTSGGWLRNLDCSPD